MHYRHDFLDGLDTCTEQLIVADVLEWHVEMEPFGRVKFTDRMVTVVTVQEDLMIPSLFICSECKEIEEDRTNVVTCAECSVGSE